MSVHFQVVILSIVTVISVTMLHLRVGPLARLVVFRISLALRKYIASQLSTTPIHWRLACKLKALGFYFLAPSCTKNKVASSNWCEFTTSSSTIGAYRQYKTMASEEENTRKSWDCNKQIKDESFVTKERVFSEINQEKKTEKKYVGWEDCNVDSFMQ